MRILVDMDGILVRLLPTLLGTYNQEHGESVQVGDITDWDIGSHVKKPKDLYRIFERPGFFDGLPPFPGAVRGFRMLQKMGHEVRVCSSPSGPDSARAKYEWCDTHLGIPRQEVILTHDKLWIEAQVLIDDKPKHLNEWSRMGRTAIGIAHPYNRSVRNAHLIAPSSEDGEGAWALIIETIGRMK